MKNIRKFLSIILSIAMVMCSTLPSVASEIEVIDETTKSKIEEQLREDLGEERANEILKGTEEITVADEETSVGANEETVGAKLCEPEEDEETTDVEDEETIVADEETTSVGAEETTEVGANADDVGANVYGALPEEEEETTDVADEVTTVATISEPEEIVISIASKSIADKNLYGADEAWMYWWLTDEDKTIHYQSTDPGSVGAEPITGTDAISYDGLDHMVKTNITMAVFENEIEAETCEKLFYEFHKLNTIVSIENLITSKVTNMSSMFYGCEKLTDLDVTGFNTSEVTNMSYMFDGCSGIEGLNLENFKTSKVTNMSFMFRDCVSLTVLDLSKFVTENVENMSGMFAGCSSLTELDLKSFKVNNVENMSSMFYYCSELIKLDITSFSPNKVKNFVQFLGYCWKLGDIDLSGLDTSSADNMDNMFLYCRSLTELDLSSFNTEKVTSMIKMFESCYELKKIIVSSKFDTSKVTDSNKMFSDCTKLVGGAGTPYDSGHIDKEYARIDKPGTPGYFTDVNWMYWYLTDDDTVIHFSSTDPGGANPISNDVEVDYPMGLAKSSIYTAVFDNEINAVTCQGFFDGFTSLFTIMGRDNLKTNNVKYMTNMFYNCQGLMTLSINGLDTSNVEDMTNMFGNCQELSGLDLRTFDTSKVKKMNNMFENCEALSSLDLSSFDTSNVTTMASMFKNCKALDTLILSSNFTTAEVTDMESMFESCEELNNPDLSSFNTSKVTNMKSMFKDCTGLVKLDLTGFNTSNVELMEKMFYKCQSLITIIASDEFRTDNVSDDGADMFYRCLNLFGSYGTRADTSSVINKDRACIDGGTSSTKGFFSSSPWMYWYLTDSNQTIHYTSSKPTSGDYEIMTRRDTIEYNGLDTTEIRAIIKAEFDNNITAVTCKNYFCDFRSLNDIVGLNKFNTQNVNSMYSMFSDCSQLDSLDLSNFKTSNVTSMGFMFYNCSSLTSLDLNKFDTSNVANTQYMLQGCSSLTKIIVSNSFVITSSVTMHDNMFTNCTNLVGGAGTTYDSEHTDNEYARIDGGPTSATPGYFTLYVPPTPPAPTPTYPQNYSSDRDGGGGSGGGGPLVNVIIPAVTYLPIVKNILATLNNTTSKWTKDTVTNKHKLNIINQNGTETPATLGFYNYTNVVTHIVNNIPVQTQTNDTYVFDEKGNMITGWVRTADGKWYLFEYEKTTNEGKMVIGWKKVQGAWYYFGLDGAMLTNAYTPDGHYVGPDGKWVENWV